MSFFLLYSLTLNPTAKSNSLQIYSIQFGQCFKSFKFVLDPHHCFIVKAPKKALKSL